MDQHEHAQQIFSMMIAGMASSGTLPSVSEAPKYAEMSVLYAGVFQSKQTAMDIAAQKAAGKYI